MEQGSKEGLINLDWKGKVLQFREPSLRVEEWRLHAEAHGEGVPKLCALKMPIAKLRLAGPQCRPVYPYSKIQTLEANCIRIFFR